MAYVVNSNAGASSARPAPGWTVQGTILPPTPPTVQIVTKDELARREGARETRRNVILAGAAALGALALKMWGK